MQLVDLVQQMDPEVSARLLAVTGAVRSSFIMMRLAARSSKQVCFASPKHAIQCACLAG